MNQQPIRYKHIQMRSDLLSHRAALGSKKHQLFWSTACRVTELAVSLTPSQDHDVRDDQTLPGLQPAINQAAANRNRALCLRQTCLAGLTPRVRSQGLLWVSFLRIEGLTRLGTNL